MEESGQAKPKLSVFSILSRRGVFSIFPHGLVRIRGLEIPAVQIKKAHPGWIAEIEIRVSNGGVLKVAVHSANVSCGFAPCSLAFACSVKSAVRFHLERLDSAANLGVVFKITP